MEATLQQKQSTEQTDLQRPFQGLRSYEEKNKAQFGGRDAEISELFELVEANRLTIVFGKSGIGKTSLLKAGLIPELQKNFFFPVYIRIDYSSDKTPLDQVKELAYSKLKTADASISEIGDRTLWEYFTNLKFLDGLLTPVLIFDQFEEIFTIGKEKNNAQKLVVELSDLAENRIPMVVQEKLQNTSELNFSVYGQQNFRVIISLREDYLAQLESLKRYLPSMKDSRFRVIQMTALQAMDAVMKPAKKLIEIEVAVEIIKKLPGINELDFQSSASNLENENRFVVEPFLLSLICYEINEKRIEKGLDKITRELVSQFDISDVINLYYSKTMQGFSDSVQRGIEETLLTEAGFRKLQSLEELQSEYEINDGEIQQLIDKRIIRKELRDGVEYVELIHDVLTPVIKAQRHKRLIELQKKEKDEAIRIALKEYRAKRKKIIGTVALIMGTAITVVLWFAMTQSLKNRKYERKDKNLQFANQLLTTSRIISNAYANDSTAALISRVAYLINKTNDGGNDITFYNSMYESSNYLINFTIENQDSTSIRAIANAGNDILYFACVNGKIYRKNGIDVDSIPQLIDDFNNRITSIAISPDKKYLAVAGVFNDIKIINLFNGEYNSKSLPTGDTLGNNKSVFFTSDGRLVLGLPTRVIGWEIETWKPIIWKQKKQLEIESGKQKRITDLDIVPYRDYFEFGSVSGFNCITVSDNKIALAIDSGIILITRDSIIKITSNNIGKTSSIAFDPSHKYLFWGNTFGTLSRMSLNNFKIENNQYQTSRISDICFNKEGSYMASASFDGTTAIWDLKNSWSSLVPLLLVPPEEKSSVYCVAFSEDSEYLLSGYFTGQIIKWPVSMKVFAELICKKTQGRLDTSILKKIIKKDFDKEIEKYNCDFKN